ncbi:hypothetical protein HUU40_17625 [candidate division KSB1 bacterium]|nr:hypothetical protein [candidate division KSB1 bacterium]
MKKSLVFAIVLLVLMTVPFSGMLIKPALAQSSSQTKFTTQLWSTTQPVCILVHNPKHEPLLLPEPYIPQSVRELYGPDVTEDLLPSLKNLPQRLHPQRILVGDNVIFAVTYGDGANEGFNDQTLGAARRTAFEFAMGVWANNLQGPATISVNATMTPRGGTATSAVLASAAPANYWRNFRNEPLGDTWYPECLVEIISGSDPDNNRLDINVDFNSDVDNATVLGNRGFYYETDASPGTDIDFVTVTIHELCHGLGFSSSFTSMGTLSSSYPTIFDRFLVDSTGTQLISKTASADNVTGNNVFWNGLRGKYMYNANFDRTNSVPMYAPTPYQGGSSLSHLDEDTFTGVWELQTPHSSGAVHVPDVIVMGILQDIGYSLPTSRYVDLNADGFEDGSSANPFNTLNEGINAVPENGALRLLPNNYRGPITLEKRMTVHSSGAVATLGMP